MHFVSEDDKQVETVIYFTTHMPWFGKSIRFGFVLASLLLVGAGCSSATAPREQASTPQAAPSVPVTQPQPQAVAEPTPQPTPAPEPAPSAPTDPNQPTKEWTVEDYFYHIPARYLTREGEGNRRVALTDERNGYQDRVIDRKNYYLLIPGNGEYYTTVAVFVKSDGGGIVGVDNRECGPLCQQEIFFLDYRNGAWVDITAQVLPSMDMVWSNLAKKRTVDEDRRVTPLWTLPRYGTRILSEDQYSDVSVYEVKWNGTTFVKKAL